MFSFCRRAPAPGPPSPGRRAGGRPQDAGRRVFLILLKTNDIAETIYNHPLFLRYFRGNW